MLQTLNRESSGSVVFDYKLPRVGLSVSFVSEDYRINRILIKIYGRVRTINLWPSLLKSCRLRTRTTSVCAVVKKRSYGANGKYYKRRITSCAYH